MSNKICIINPENVRVADKLSAYGYKCIFTEKSTNVSEEISLHADVLYLKLNDKDIIISDCQKSNITLLTRYGFNVSTVNLSKGYKTESKLNIAVTDKTIICNMKTCLNLTEISDNKEIIDVNQGYTNCSTIVISDIDYITEDIGIYNRLTKKNKNCLLIEKGQVNLDGYEYGFIGGASVYLETEKILLFFGDIRKHSDYNYISEFCKNINIKIDCIEEMDLVDLGGAVILNS